VVERKHRYIFDVARSLLVEIHVPQYLWSDVVTTAAYLINRLLSTPLGGTILVSRLFPKKETFPLEPYVFGCTTFVKNLSLGFDKLAPRSIKSVFVGYPHHQKRYRCYHPPSHHYFVSADVTFIEDVLYFTSPIKSSLDEGIEASSSSSLGLVLVLTPTLSFLPDRESQ
jgi:hypothetical protein